MFLANVFMKRNSCTDLGFSFTYILTICYLCYILDQSLALQYFMAILVYLYK